MFKAPDVELMYQPQAQPCVWKGLQGRLSQVGTVDGGRWQLPGELAGQLANGARLSQRWQLDMGWVTKVTCKVREHMDHRGSQGRHC